MSRQKSLFVLGAGGFIGQCVVRHALDAGCKVSGLVRSEIKAHWLESISAHPVLGDASNVQTWAYRLADHDYMVDLLQPAIPRCLTRRRMNAIVSQRLEFTTNILRSLVDRPRDQRPLWFSVSGCNDLQPDSSRSVRAGSTLRAHPSGFGQIGIPVRRAVEVSGVDAVFLYLGHVYGAGKSFGETILPGIAKGKFPIIGKGDTYLPLVHVEDVARAIVHLTDQDRNDLVGRQFVVADGGSTTMKDLVELAAELAGVQRPGHVPVWLAKMASGSVLISEMLDDVRADPGALLKTGFLLQYPVLRDGLRATMSELGLLGHSRRSHTYA